MDSIYYLYAGILLTICPLLYLWVRLTEESYLGSQWLAKRYDRSAPTYEQKWQKRSSYKDQALTRSLFIEPILKTTVNSGKCLVGDLACGTGRFSLLLLSDPQFHGQIEAIDISSGMLAQFRNHLSELPTETEQKVIISQLDVKDWQPREESAFDAIALLEVGELLNDLPSLLLRVASGLKPGGLLLTTRAASGLHWLFPGRMQSRKALTECLQDCGFERITIQPWRRRYDVVTAHRRHNHVISSHENIE